MTPRWPAALAAGAAALALLAPTAGANESISSGNWANSGLDPATPGSGLIGSYELKGTFRHSVNRDVQITVTADPAGTGACAVVPASLEPGPTPRAFDVTVAFPCNGAYKIIATATTTNNAVLAVESATLDRNIAISAPSPVVTGLHVRVRERLADLTWNDMTTAAPDLTGYIIERKIDKGSFTQLNRVAASDRTYTDSHLPSKGGQATYRVLATRPSPDGEQVSPSAQEGSGTFASAPTTDSSVPGGTGGMDGAIATDGTGVPGSDGTGGSGGSSSPGSGGASVTPPRIFFGSFLPPLLRPTITTPTTSDTGFNEVLPYGKRPTSSPDDLPGEGLSSISSGATPRRGMVIPVATALVLASWAVHLRMLARAARPLD